MNFFSKMRPGQVQALPQKLSRPGNIHPATKVAVTNAGTPASTPGVQSKAGRQSNGLKEFLWQLEGIGHGHLLDLGPARQTTITFFIERGFKVYTEDLLATWQYFLEEQGQQVKRLPADADRSDYSLEGRAEKFLKTTMQYPDDTFDAILMWDNLDYLDNELMTRL